MEDKITLIRGKVEDVQLPVAKVEIIISEWMGYFLLYESMLDSVLYARDKYLVEGGLMLPDRVSLHMVGIEHSKFIQEKFGFWDNICDVKMTSIKRAVFNEPQVEKVAKENIVTSTCTFFTLDLYNAEIKDLTFAHKYQVHLKTTDTVHALACWFDAEFTSLNKKQVLSTSPYKLLTHWRQTIFHLGKPIKATEGNAISGSIAIKRSDENFRELDIKFSFHYKDDKEDVNYIQLYKLR